MSSQIVSDSKYHDQMIDNTKNYDLVCWPPCSKVVESIIELLKSVDTSYIIGESYQHGG